MRVFCLLMHALSSPRPWGCFHILCFAPTRSGVFPTPVGVFLLYGAVTTHNNRLPHARGGVSVLHPAFRLDALSSPRPWGCFIVCTLFCDSLQSLPHARGGVSAFIGQIFGGLGSSPRPWGCFFRDKYRIAREKVFPTPVGVFPITCSLAQGLICLPHARGGVSNPLVSGLLNRLSSPRPWGCFLSAR